MGCLIYYSFQGIENGYEFDISYIVLAVGKSRRLGHNKIKEVIGNRTPKHI
jgi:hypothetical protein